MQGSTVLITGGARRVGRHVGRRLAERGANIVINFRASAAEAQAACAEFEALGVGALAVQADVSTAPGVQSVLNAARARFGAIEVLVNNASIYGRSPLAQVTEADWLNNINVNLLGPCYGCWLVGLHMRERGRGKIINIADWAVDRPYVDYAPYFVAKGGVVALTKVMAKELAPQVTVNAIAPGPILMPPDFDAATVTAVERAVPLGRIGSPEDIAQTIIYLVEGTDFVTGAVIPVDGGRRVS
ncbi:MAG: SDR family oxidoreductase [Actinobacteria bacterium]|nr:SDR family oxidoreductase [Actinomycetota bacterium]